MLQDYIVLLDDIILCLNFRNSTTKIIIIYPIKILRICITYISILNNKSYLN